MQTKEFREPGHEEISCAAYHRWLAAGSGEGNADGNWFAAGTALMQRQAHQEGIEWTRRAEDSLPS